MGDITNGVLEQGWLYGWKAIAQRCGVTVKTVKKYYKVAGLPVRRTPTGRPVALYYELDKWLILYDEKKRGEIGFIYFIQSENNDLIKIGFTVDLNRRIKMLQNMSPVKLKLLGSQKGSINDERKLHKRFKKYRSHGEWFEPKKIIINYINKLNNL